jgi:hypothetical protein
MNKFLSKILFVFLMIFLLPGIIKTQTKENIVAEIANSKITEKEFLFRLELSPFITHKSAWNQDSLKSDFLYSLVAEKLWYLDALEKGLANSEEFRFYFKPLEDIFLRDALFKKEIEEKIKLSADDVAQAIDKAQYKLVSKIISSTDSSLIFNLYNKMLLTENKDSMLSSKEFSSLTANQFEISIGSLKDEEVENFLFKLSPNQFTTPIRGEVGWVIFFIQQKTFTPVDISDQKSINKIKSIVRNRRIMKRTNEYLQQLLGNITIKIDEEAFKLVAEKIYERLNFLSQTRKDTSGFILNDDDYRIIKHQLGKENLDKELFRIKNQKVTIWDFLANLAFEEHRFQSAEKNFVFQKLNRLAKDFVQQQLLTYEAKRLGLEKEKKVYDELEMWKQNYLAQLNKISYLDSARVSDEDITNFSESLSSGNNQLVYVNLKILTLSSLQEMENVLKQMTDGVSFDDIVMQFGKTDSLVNENAETGLQPAFALGDIGTIASNLKLNEVYGPIRRNNGYSLLKVIDKKLSNDSVAITNESTKEKLRNFLFQKKLNEVVSKRTIQLAEKYNAKIYEDVALRIKSTGIQMFVHRLMGFGGRIAGVPLLDNWADFIDTKKLREVMLP